MDEPCSALDPLATLKIEELMQELKKNYTIVIVTHNMQQAARTSDWTGFFHLGEMLEYDPTGDYFYTTQKTPKLKIISQEDMDNQQECQISNIQS